MSGISLQSVLLLWTVLVGVHVKRRINSLQNGIYFGSNNGAEEQKGRKRKKVPYRVINTKCIWSSRTIRLCMSLAVVYSSVPQNILTQRRIRHCHRNYASAGYQFTCKKSRGVAPSTCKILSYPESWQNSKNVFPNSSRISSAGMSAKWKKK